MGLQITLNFYNIFFLVTVIYLVDVALNLDLNDLKALDF